MDETIIHVGSIFGKETRQPLVELGINDTRTLLTLTQARAIALQLLEASESAETDAFFFSWGVKNASSLTIMHLVRDFRQFRDEQRAKDGK